MNEDVLNLTEIVDEHIITTINNGQLEENEIPANSTSTIRFSSIDNGKMENIRGFQSQSTIKSYQSQSTMKSLHNVHYNLGRDAFLRQQESMQIKTNVWYKDFDWVLFGYYIFLIGSMLYFAQSLIPFYTTSDSPPHPQSLTNSTITYTYYYYGSNPPLYPKNIGGWEGLVGSAIFLLDSLIYIVGWFAALLLDAEMGIKSSIPWWQDFNMTGNILYFLLSLGYLITAIFNLEAKYSHSCIIANLIFAIFFVIDSFLYLLALTQGSYSKTSCSSRRILNDIDWLELKDKPSRIDYYTVGSIMFLMGAIIYVIGGVFQYYNRNIPFLYLLGSIIFLVDSVIYIISAYQYRSIFFEIPFIERRNFLLIELIND